MVNSIYCSFRELGFGSQNPHSCLHFVHNSSSRGSGVLSKFTAENEERSVVPLYSATVIYVDSLHLLLALGTKDGEAER